MPLASLTRLVQTMIGHGMTDDDFAQLVLLQAQASGVALEPENVPVADGLGDDRTGGRAHQTDLVEGTP